VFGGLIVINSFPVKRTLRLHERVSGTYFASAYFIGKILFDMFVRLTFKYKLIYVLISYFLVMYCLFSYRFTRHQWFPLYVEQQHEVLQFYP